jgi:ribosomal protein S18 acetylase RimI-like enzyme
VSHPNDSSAREYFQLRPAVDADLPRVREIIVESFDGVTANQLLEQRYGKIGGRSWREWKAAEIERSFHGESEAVLVAERAGKIVGVISYRLDRRRLIGTIGNNGVDPQHQGQGIGTWMYKQVLAIFRASGMRFADVSTGLDVAAARARRAYEKVGFKPLTSSVRYFQEL